MESGLGENSCRGLLCREGAVRAGSVRCCLGPALSTRWGCPPRLSCHALKPPITVTMPCMSSQSGGEEFSVRFPSSVPATANLIGFASSGRSAYLQVPSAAVLHLSDELIQVDFSPLRLFPVPGSGGLGEIVSVTNSVSGDLLVAAAYGQQGLCGAYDIDTSSGTHRRIKTGAEMYVLHYAG